MVEEGAGLSVEALIGRLKAELTDFSGGLDWTDDLTVVVVKEEVFPAEKIVEGSEQQASEQKVDTDTPEKVRHKGRPEYSLSPEER